MGNGNADSFMTSVAACGIEVMASTAECQNRLRALESRIAQEETHMECLSIKNQVAAVRESGQKQADSYYAQAGQSFASGVMEGGQAAGSGTFGELSWKEEGSTGEIVPREGLVGGASRLICGFFGGSSDGKLQLETQSLAKQVDAHKALLADVDNKLNARPVQGPNAAAGQGSSQTVVPLTPDQKVIKAALGRDYNKPANLTKDNKDNYNKVLDSMRGDPLVSGGGPPTERTELDEYREKLQSKIEHKEKLISGKQSEINNIRQYRAIKFNAVKDMINGISNALQAGYAKEKAEQDALNTEWAFNKELASNVFGAASQAMNDCNSHTEKMIDGMTGALRHAVGGG